MGMVRRMKTTSKLPIPEGAIREAGLIFHHDIVSKVKRHKIPDVLILNLDQTPSKYVTVVQTTLAKKTSKFAAIAGRSDKRSITATFAVTLTEHSYLCSRFMGERRLKAYVNANFLPLSR